MARILCIDDSQEFYTFLQGLLKEHALTHSTSIQQALKILGTGRESFDLVLLDISMPDGNGLNILPQIKDFYADKQVPILVVSSDDNVLTKVAAFGIGADDYISKPPVAGELRARIEARLRAARVTENTRSQLSFGDIAIDTAKMHAEMKLKNGSSVLELTPSEFKILKLLISRPNLVYSRDQIIDMVWGVDKHVTSRTIDTHVSHLRKKITKSSVEIKTILESGYKATLK